jgi:hypothetical protein
MRKFLQALVFIVSASSAACSGQGFHGYISCYSGAAPANYNAGVGFYSAIWRLIPVPISDFQIGLPGTWVTPDNSDDVNVPLCPVGTYARDNWVHPTYAGTFETIEGGPGYWAGNRFLYGPPKFMMNSTPDCYTNEVATPGWQFFWSNTPLDDTLMGIAQIANRILMPPDGMTFSGEPKGEFLGTAYMALPLTSAKTGTTPVGELSWTLFLGADNFKGPLAFFLPETWARISKNYGYDNGRGLDARLFKSGSTPDPAMEINTVPYFVAGNTIGDTFSRIPPIQFPVDASGQTVLVRDYMVYSKQAIFNDILAWRAGGTIPAGTFNTSGAHKMTLNTDTVDYDQDGMLLYGINTLAKPTIFNSYDFGLKWSLFPSGGGMAKFPEYYKQIGHARYGLDSALVPASFGLHNQKFNTPNPNPDAYDATPLKGAWATPGPVAGPFQKKLADGSTVTYYWYKFIEQPVFRQYNWTQLQKDSLQNLIVQMHTNWSITQNYMAPPSSGSLVTFDTALFVTPPAGYTVGYVPIVTKQEIAKPSVIEKQITVVGELTVYPNPSGDIFKLQRKAGGGVIDYVLTDFFGRKIRTVHVPQGITELDLGTYAKGVYFLSPVAPATGSTYKLMKY